MAGPQHRTAGKPTGLTPIRLQNNNTHYCFRPLEVGAIHGRTYFHTYSSGEDVRTAVKAFLLVQVDDDGRAESHFRFTLEGKKLEADFRSEDIFSNESLAGYSL